MIKKQLTTDLIHYMFEPDNGKHFGFNLIALRSKDKILLIDTGYEKHAELVFNDLSKNNFTIEKAIITHFHDDHTFGLKALPNVSIYGSHKFQATLNLWTDKKDHFTPTYIIDHESTIQFYEHEIRLIPLPGHSVCELILVVNNEFLFVGDEIMTSNEGIPLLPWVDRIDNESITRHLNSLKTLKSFTDFNTIIPAHGKIMNQTEFQIDIDNRITYFETILNSEKSLSYKEATIKCTMEFLHQEWFGGIYDE